MLIHRFYQAPGAFAYVPGAPVCQALPAVTGVPDNHTVGSVLTCATGTWAGTATITFAYQWYQTSVIGPPVNLDSPSISGSLIVTSVLHCSIGLWNGDEPITYSYQWTRLPSTNIGDGTADYTTVPADIGQTISCTVTATNGAGTDSADVSSAVGPVYEPTGVLFDELGDPLTVDAEELTV